ncbi:MAG: outer membrane beta-barrel protein [Alphaproteobacteria bacterium]|nr:outer membrane beta-barrel protein [Alphaproteobacteria bacterium]
MRRLALLAFSLALAVAASAQELRGAQDGAAEGPITAPPDPVSVGERFDRFNASPGMQAGPWKVTPTATLRGGYDDNVTTVSVEPVATPFAQLRGRIDAVNADGPDSFLVYAEATQTWYFEASDLDQFDARGGLDFAVQADDYVRIRGGIGVSTNGEIDSANEGIVIGGAFDPYVDLARYLAIPASLGVTYDTGRWFVRADGALTYYDYDDRTTLGGTKVDQDFRSGTVADLDMRAGWHFSPSTSVFVQGGYNLQRFDDKSANSDGWRAVAGLQFELSRLLTGEVFAGYAAQSYAGSGDTTGLTYGASLDWFATELVSLHLQARRDFGAERTAIVGGASVTSPVTHDSVAFQVEYEPLRQVLIRGRAGYQWDTYEGSDRTDKRFFAGLGADYVITPNFRLNLDYLYDETTSAIAGNSTRNVISLGLTAGY